MHIVHKLMAALLTWLCFFLIQQKHIMWTHVTHNLTPNINFT